MVGSTEEKLADEGIPYGVGTIQNDATANNVGPLNL